MGFGTIKYVGTGGIHSGYFVTNDNYPIVSLAGLNYIVRDKFDNLYQVTTSDADFDVVEYYEIRKVV